MLRGRWREGGEEEWKAGGKMEVAGAINDRWRFGWRERGERKRKRGRPICSIPQKGRKLKGRERRTVRNRMMHERQTDRN